MNIRKKALVIVAAVLLAAPARQAAAQVTLFSETFGGGNPANASDYTLIPEGSQTLAGNYRIVSNPATSFSNGYSPFFDHTLGTAAGQMLFFDGPSGARIFFRSANLTAGTTYTFSFWGASASPLTPPVLAAQVNGVTIGTSLATTSATWNQRIATFTPLTTGAFIFSIVDFNGDALAGNDGAIDDILLTAPAGQAFDGPEPATFALLGFVGIPATFAARRIRRRSRP